MARAAKRSQVRNAHVPKATISDVMNIQELRSPAIFARWRLLEFSLSQISPMRRPEINGAIPLRIRKARPPFKGKRCRGARTSGLVLSPSFHDSDDLNTLGIETQIKSLALRFALLACKMRAMTLKEMTSRGGKARAASLTKERRIEIARKAGQASARNRTSKQDANTQPNEKIAENKV